MKNIMYLVLACAASIAGYLAVFGFLLSRPLTIDQSWTLLEKKLDYAARAKSPKIFILAGSNARFSHSCKVLEKVLRHPCINLGVSADIGIDWVIDEVRPDVRPGDLFYVPAEYDLYTTPRSLLFSGQDAAFRFRHDKSSLMARGPEGLVRAAFMFDLSSMVRSVGEMALNAAGVTRRFGVATMDEQGDEVGHGDVKAKPYEAIIQATQFVPPQVADFEQGEDGGQFYLGKFLDWCRARHVEAVGGLPTTFADVDIPRDAVANIAEFYGRHGAAFLVLPDRSQFPRRDFFDTPYHLRDQAQIAHSQQLANALRPLVAAWPR